MFFTSINTELNCKRNWLLFTHQSTLMDTKVRNCSHYKSNFVGADQKRNHILHKSSPQLN